MKRIYDSPVNLNADTDALMRRIMATWDEKAWAKLRELYPEAANALTAAVEGGLEPKVIADYCKRHGYLPGIGDWLTQAATHLRTIQAEIDRMPDFPFYPPVRSDE